MKSVLVLFLLLISGPAQSEIYKLAIPTDTCIELSCIELYWWPVLPKITGWYHDRYNSVLFGANTQAPDGFTFKNAETVIYAKAIFKPRVPELKNIDEFIASDHVRFSTKYPRLVISAAEPITTLDGQSLTSFTFFPENEGNWEQVAYGEEGEYYIVFAISSRTKDGLNNSLSDYEQFINSYQEWP